MGEKATWDRAEAAIRRVLEAAGMPFEVDEGGGAFYGPKIDLKIRDAIGREWQCTTFQLDFQMPERFELEYVAPDGSRQRPVMIHRALFGSMERFMAVLIEHFAGAFPLWLAPVQARVVTVSEKADVWGREVQARLLAADLRADADLSPDKLGAKIRRAQMEKIPYMLVVGERDMAARVVSPRTRDGQQMPATPLDELAQRLVAEAVPPVLGAPSAEKKPTG
jgi:threonyl-tRNA synthetase